MRENDLALETASYLSIDKEQIPYRFTYDHLGKIFEIEFRYNAQGDFFTADLTLLQNEFKNILVQGEKIMLGQMLFQNIFYEHIDTPPLLPWDFSERATRAGWEEMDHIVLVVMNDDALA